MIKYGMNRDRASDLGAIRHRGHRFRLGCQNGLGLITNEPFQNFHLPSSYGLSSFGSIVELRRETHDKHVVYFSPPSLAALSRTDGCDVAAEDECLDMWSRVELDPG